MQNYCLCHKFKQMATDKEKIINRHGLLSKNVYAHFMKILLYFLS